jgi:hypothetical protein
MFPISILRVHPPRIFPKPSKTVSITSIIDFIISILVRLTMIQVPNLAPDYYLSNFRFLVNWVVKHYEDLLSPEEQHFIESFEQLPHHSQCLFVRLSNRSGPFFRADKINYQEISNLQDAADHLIQCGFIDINSPLSITEVAKLLNKIELLNLFFSNQKTERKRDLINRLAIQYPDTKTWQEWTQGHFGQVYRVNTKNILTNFILLFFGNAYQDLTDFVLQDIGLFRYENYSIDHQHRIFKNREELLHYQQLLLLREQMELASAPEELINLSLQIPFSVTSETLLRRKSKLCNHLAYALEQQKQHDLAFNLYQQSHLPPARERQIRLLEKQGKYSEAWSMLETVIQQPVDEQELQIAERILPRIAKKLCKTLIKKESSPLLEALLHLPRLINEEGSHLNVEEIVRSHFHSDQEPCLYVENQLFPGLFGLWLWPEMFRGLDGAFANPLQSAPLDMYEQNFAVKRPGIANLFQLFSDNAYKEHIWNMWKLKYGLSNHFVSWNFLDEQIIAMALESIPAQHLKLIFQRILFDIRNNRSGLPDLVQFFPDKNNYRMIEVKGPGDRLQDNQQRWLEFFSTNNIPAEVVYVRWQ